MSIRWLSGHGVRTAKQVAVGNSGQTCAYCVGNLVCLTSPDLALLGYVTLPSRAICVAVHPTKPVVACGTATTGLHIIDEARSAKRLNSVSGSHVLDDYASCVAFATSAVGGTVLLAVHGNSAAGSPQSIAVWSLLSSAVMLSISVSAGGIDHLSALSGQPRFVTCSKTSLSLWDITSAKLTERPCPILAELRGAQFACVHYSKQSILALTSGGFLACYDPTTAAVKKWMDCKVCPATFVISTEQYVLVGGSAVRLFAAANWEFLAKVKAGLELPLNSAASFLTDLSHGVCLAGLMLEQRLVLFYGSGSLAVFDVAQDPIKKKICASRILSHTATRNAASATHLLALPAGGAGEASRLVVQMGPQLAAVEEKNGVECLATLVAPVCCAVVGTKPPNIVFAHTAGGIGLMSFSGEIVHHETIAGTVVHIAAASSSPNFYVVAESSTRSRTMFRCRFVVEGAEPEIQLAQLCDVEHSERPYVVGDDVVLLAASGLRVPSTSVVISLDNARSAVALEERIIVVVSDGVVSIDPKAGRCQPIRFLVNTSVSLVAVDPSCELVAVQNNVSIDVYVLRSARKLCAWTLPLGQNITGVAFTNSNAVVAIDADGVVYCYALPRDAARTAATKRRSQSPTFREMQQKLNARFEDIDLALHRHGSQGGTAQATPHSTGPTRCLEQDVSVRSSGLLFACRRSPAKTPWLIEPAKPMVLPRVGVTTDTSSDPAVASSVGVPEPKPSVSRHADPMLDVPKVSGSESLGRPRLVSPLNQSSDSPQGKLEKVAFAPATEITDSLAGRVLAEERARIGDTVADPPQDNAENADTVRMGSIQMESAAEVVPTSPPPTAPKSGEAPHVQETCQSSTPQVSPSQPVGTTTKETHPPQPEMTEAGVGASVPVPSLLGPQQGHTSEKAVTETKESVACGALRQSIRTLRATLDTVRHSTSDSTTEETQAIREDLSSMLCDVFSYLGTPHQPSPPASSSHDSLMLSAIWSELRQLREETRRAPK